MSVCLKLSLVGLVAALFGSHGALAAGNTARVRSVVKADARGRLVRAVVVSAPRPVQPRREVAPPAPVQAIVEEAARKYEVDPLLVHSVIRAESGYNQYAVSPKGAQGLMQLMPGTARRFGVSNSFDPRENIEGGVRYLKYLSTLFPEQLDLAIAAYNAGEGAVWKYNYRIPPYRETQEYVQKVSMHYRASRDANAQQIASSQADPAPAEPAGPTYAPVRHFVDASGRLHLTTLEPAADGPFHP